MPPHSRVASHSPGQLASGPLSSGPLSSGPLSSGPLSSGPLSSGPLSSGPLSSGPLSSGTDGQEGAGDPHLLRFGLRQLFWFGGAARRFSGADDAEQRRVATGDRRLTVLATAHVLGTLLGTRLRDSSVATSPLAGSQERSCRCAGDWRSHAAFEPRRSSAWPAGVGVPSFAHRHGWAIAAGLAVGMAAGATAIRLTWATT